MKLEVCLTLTLLISACGAGQPMVDWTELEIVDLLREGYRASDEMRYDEAQQAFDEALRLSQSTAEVRREAQSHQAVGSVLDKRAKYQEALKHYGKARSLYAKTIGDKHPGYASLLNDMGVTWYHLGHHEKAIGCFMRALPVDRNAYGERHPTVARDLNNIGKVWLALGKYDKALDHFEEALAINKETLGDKHPKVAEVLSSIGEIWWARDNCKKATGYFERALAIHEEHSGGEHPDVETISTILERCREEKSN
jgi:tetratricopeptide (TPR) repeat protein